MFQRYTEKARRVIFFARYEASQYGSPYMESEHFLLGLLREDLGLVRRFLGPNSVTTDIRAEIERQITRRERISTSVEVPLTTECKKILEPGHGRIRKTRSPVGQNGTHFAWYIRGRRLASCAAPAGERPQGARNPRAVGQDSCF